VETAGDDVAPEADGYQADIGSSPLRFMAATTGSNDHDKIADRQRHVAADGRSALDEIADGRASQDDPRDGVQHVAEAVVGKGHRP
jgi:hypothetical protein